MIKIPMPPSPPPTCTPLHTSPPLDRTFVLNGDKEDPARI